MKQYSVENSQYRERFKRILGKAQISNNYGVIASFNGFKSLMSKTDEVFILDSRKQSNEKYENHLKNPIYKKLIECTNKFGEETLPASKFGPYTINLKTFIEDLIKNGLKERGMKKDIYKTISNIEDVGKLKDYLRKLNHVRIFEEKRAA